MFRAEFSPALLRWARDRAGNPLKVLAGHFRKLEQWEKGRLKPSLKQVEALTKVTLTLFRDAMPILGIAKVRTLHRPGRGLEDAALEV
jgi:hypothetical protein